MAGKRQRQKTTNQHVYCRLNMKEHEDIAASTNVETTYLDVVNVKPSDVTRLQH